MNSKFLFFDNPLRAIYFCLVFLLVVGGINIYSASFVYAATEFHNPYHFILRYVLFALAGLAAMLAARKIGYRSLVHERVLTVMGGLVGLALLVVLLWGPRINAAQRWLSFGFFNLQPSEFAKLFVIMLSSGLFGKLVREGRRVNLFHAPALHAMLGVALLSALILVEPDMGTAIIVLGLYFVMCFLGGIREAQIYMVLLVFFCIGCVGTYMAPYRFSRILSWWDPWKDAMGAGYQMVQSQIAIGSGRFTGMEWGGGMAKYFFLPEIHTDFAFSIFCQENGFLGALVLIFLLLLLGYSLWTVAKRSTDPVGVLLSCGVTFLLVGQAVANIAMVCGLLPIIGVPLAFVSYGGSSMFVTLLSIGLILSVYDGECKREENMRTLLRFASESPEQRRHDWQVIEGGQN